MALMREFRTPSDFWSGMVEPDFADYKANRADLRAAFHAAISLIHMHDWVWKMHCNSLKALFTYKDGDGNPNAVNLELAVIDADGVHALVFPCRRILRSWVKAETTERVDVHPTPRTGGNGGIPDQPFFLSFRPLSAAASFSSSSASSRSMTLRLAASVSVFNNFLKCSIFAFAISASIVIARSWLFSSVDCYPIAQDRDT